MRSRRPSFDFSETPARWTANNEFAHEMNASSCWIPLLERFLNRVMAKALTQLKYTTGTEQLREDVRVFIRQEANHYSLHGDFNAILTASGYNLTPFLEHFESEFKRIWETKSFAFQLAYCEGFETIGPPAALMWLDESEDILAGANKEAVRLWKWHLMEEYEHRTVCYDVFKALHGGYFLRVYGFLYQLWHLGRFSLSVRNYLLEQDRSSMTSAERKASIQSTKQIKRRMLKKTLPRLLRALSPFYSPRNAKEPVNFRAYREQVEAELK